MVNPDQANNFHFKGFGRPKSNYFKMPMEWTNLTAQINSLAEVKVVEYVLKHTWGYQEFGIAKKITTDEFINGRKRKNGSRLDNGTGLDAKSVRSGLQKAVEHGLIIEEMDNSDKGRIKKYYLIRMNPESTEDEGSPSEGAETETDDTQDEVSHLIGKISPSEEIGKISPSGGETFPLRGEKFPHRTEKETIERNLKKENPSKFRKVQTFKKNGNGQEPSPELVADEKDIEQSKGGKPYSENIAELIEDLTKHHLHDVEHINSNITQAQNLWRDSQFDEDTFIELIHEAKQITLKYTGSIRKKVQEPYSLGLKNRAPYFFKVLKNLIRQTVLEQQHSTLLAKLVTSREV